MASKKLQVRMTDSDLEMLKKRAVFAGKNISDFARDLIHSGLENRPESHHVSSPTIDPEIIRKEIDFSLKFGLEPALKAITLLREEISGLSKNPAPDPVRNAPGPAPEIKSEVVRFLAEKAAKTDALLESVASKISGKSVEAVREEISAELSKSPAAGPHGNGPETIRFLAEKAALIDALLQGVSSKISGSNVGDHGDRMKKALATVQYELKKLFGG